MVFVLGSLNIKVPYFMKDPKRDHNFDKHPLTTQPRREALEPSNVPKEPHQRCRGTRTRSHTSPASILEGSRDLVSRL